MADQPRACALLQRDRSRQPSCRCLRLHCIARGREGKGRPARPRINDKRRPTLAMRMGRQSFLTPQIPRVFPVSSCRSTQRPVRLSSGMPSVRLRVLWCRVGRRRGQVRKPCPDCVSHQVMDHFEVLRMVNAKLCDVQMYRSTVSPLVTVIGISPVLV